MTVVSEVAQASMKYWRPSEDAGEHSIFLEVYVEHKKPSLYSRVVRCKICRCGPCRKKKKQGMYTRHQTQPVPEAREMRWRQYTEDWFLVALFSLGGTNWVMRQGDEVALAADVYRTTFDSNVTTKVHTLRGSFRVGSWGAVALRSFDANQEHAQLPEVVLELRPMSTRPFNLEFARPREYLETIEDVFIRQCAERLRISSIMEKRESLGMGFRSTLSLFRHSFSLGGFESKRSTSDRIINLKDKVAAKFRPIYRRKKKEPREARNSGSSNRDSTTSAQAGSSQATFQSQATSDADLSPTNLNGDPHERCYYVSEDSAASSMGDSPHTPTTPKSPWKSFSKLQNTGTLFDRTKSSERPKLPSVDEDRMAYRQEHQLMGFDNSKGDDSECLSPKSPHIQNSFRESATTDTAIKRGNFEATYSMASGAGNEIEHRKRKLQLLIGQRTPKKKRSSHLESPRSSQTSHLSENRMQSNEQCNEWRPADWQNIWKSSWPSASNHLTERTQVVPLMEAEFKKDCIVLYNTLFPRVQSEGFQTLRNLALDLGSKIQWKPTRNRGSLSKQNTNITLRSLGSGETPVTESDGRPPTRNSSFSFFDEASNAGRGIRRGDSELMSRRSDSEVMSNLESSGSVTDAAEVNLRMDVESVDFETNGEMAPTDPERRRPRWFWALISAFKRILTCRCRRRRGGGGSPELHKLERTSSGEGSLPFSPVRSPEQSASQDEAHKRLERLRGSMTKSHLLCITDDAGDKSFGDNELSLDVRLSGPFAASKGCMEQRSLSSSRRASSASIASEEISKGPGLIKAENGGFFDETQVSADPANCDFNIGNATASCSTTGSLCGALPPKAETSTSIIPLVAHRREEQPVSDHMDPCMSTASTISVRSDVSQAPGPPSSPSKLEQLAAARMPLWSLMTKNGFVQDEYTPRIMFLKRLLIVFAVCGVYYTEDSNSMQLGDLWPYPIAAILGHGARILIRLEDVEGSEFINFLLFGDPHRVDWRLHGVPQPLKRRIAATHAVEIERETGHLIEKKLKVLNAADSVQNLSDGIRKKHLGINLPIGGVGNMSPLGRDHLIEFTGKVVARRNREKAKSGIIQRALSSKGSKHSAAMRNSSTGSRISRASKDSRNSKIAVTGFEAIQEEAAAACSLPAEMTRTASMGSMGSTVSTVSSVRGDVFKDTWKPLPNVQHGHLYMRIDDFGEQYSCPCWLEGSQTKKSRSEEVRRRLRSGEPVDSAFRRADPFSVHAGDLMCIGGVSLPSAKAHKSDAVTRLRDGVTGPRLIRVSSEPIVDRRNKFISEEDIRWAEDCINSQTNQRLRPPPSAEALRLLLERMDPLSTRLFGTGQFKAIEDFHHELHNTSCFLVKRSKTLRRCIEKVVLKLRWKGQTLMQTHEIDEKNTNICKRELLAASMKQSDDRLQIVKDLLVGLGIPQESVDESWDKFESFFYNSEGSHLSDRSESSSNQTYGVVEQKVASSSYPGIISIHTTHMITWDVLHESSELWRNLGLPISEKARAHNVNNADITAARETSTGFRVHCWRWVPEAEVMKFNDVRAAETAAHSSRNQWVSYALEKEGPLQCPPTENSLLELFQRSGIAFYQSGSEQARQTARNLWLELTSQECFLQMSGGRPVRVVEAMLIRMRWRSSKAQPWQLLVQTQRESLELLRKTPKGQRPSASDESPRADKASIQLLRCCKFKDEKWEECALRCIQDRANLAPQQVRSILDHKPSDVSAYTFYEKEKQSEKYSGIQTLYRTHLVTYTLKEDAYTTSAGRFILGVSDAVTDRLSSLSRRRISQHSSASDKPAGMELQPGGILERQGSSLEASLAPGREVVAISDLARTHFEWLLEDEVLSTIAGGTLWAEASKNRERHRVSSVLLGLEGSAPNFKSPFGGSHDASGEPNKISALGGRKWRSYRINNAWQIPADEGGMRIQVTRQMISELTDMVNLLDLVEPSLDIVCEGVFPRDEINQRHAEQELFKQILMGSSRQARKAVEDMVEYRTTNKTLGQAYLAVSSGMRRT